MGRSKKRAQERAAERKKQRQRTTLIVVGVIALLVAVGAILATRPTVVEIDDVLLTKYAGIPTSTTDRGFPVLGNPEAPAQLVEYSSFDCPACADFHENVTNNIIDRIRAGEASFTYVPVSGTGSIPNGDRAVRAFICAEEQGLAFEYHDLLFSWQRVNQASAFQNARLEAGAEALGMDLEAFNECRNSARANEIEDNARAAFGTAGGGTPTVLVNGQATSPTLAGVNQQIDIIMASAEPVPVEVVEEEPEAVEEEIPATDEAEEPETTETEAVEEAEPVETEALEEAPAEDGAESEATEAAEETEDEITVTEEAE